MRVLGRVASKEMARALGAASRERSTGGRRTVDRRTARLARVGGTLQVLVPVERMRRRRRAHGERQPGEGLEVCDGGIAPPPRLALLRREVVAHGAPACV